MKFSHKILLAAALVVAVAFACFIFFNDYRQREALSSSTEASMQELGSLTTSNIQTWLESRIQLLQSLSQQVAIDGNAPASLKRIIDLPAYTGNFQLSYFGGTDGVMFSVPAGNRAPDYDPRARAGIKRPTARSRPSSPNRTSPPRRANWSSPLPPRYSVRARCSAWPVRTST
ncbi:hypothetical protein [Pseudomonas baetica]|uniref:hypothetical protein n=1 Tax=Pseudomonas baetica TaxID=674054 RepID=UPI00268024D5